MVLKLLIEKLNAVEVRVGEDNVHMEYDNSKIKGDAWNDKQ